MSYKKKTFEEFKATITNKNIEPSFYYTDYIKIAEYLEKYREVLLHLGDIDSKEMFVERFKQIYEMNNDYIEIVPLFTAVRPDQLIVIDKNGKQVASFSSENVSFHEAINFLDEVNFFNIFNERPINLYSYYYGVEVGFDTNARKNRGGQQMERVVGSYVKNLIAEMDDIDFISQASIHNVKSKWGITIQSPNERLKRFDFIIKKDESIYFIEANFFNGGGSKTNINDAFINLQRDIENYSTDNHSLKFILVTDGMGLLSAERELKDVFNKIEYVLNINDLKDNALFEIINSGK